MSNNKLITNGLGGGSRREHLILLGLSSHAIYTKIVISLRDRSINPELDDRELSSSAHDRALSQLLKTRPLGYNLLERSYTLDNRTIEDGNE